MQVQVVIPVPLDSEEVWKMFRVPLQRFCDTWRKYPPGVRCSLFAVTQGADPTQEVVDMFMGLPVIFERYDKGADLGAQQYIARVSDNAFQVNMTSRCYFHRSGWLLRYVESRMRNGSRIYGASSSFEGSFDGQPYVCTRAHAYDTDHFRLYPHDILSRDQGVFFECGEGCVTRFFQRLGLEASIIHWDEIVPCGTKVSGGFRDGDQNAMLVWDRHTDIFRDADRKEKKRLAEMAFDNDKVTLP